MKIIAPTPHPAQYHFFINLLGLAGLTDEESQKLLDDNPLEAQFMQCTMDFLLTAIIAPLTVKDVDVTSRMFYQRMHGFSPAPMVKGIVPTCMLGMIEKYRGEKFDSVLRCMFHFDPYSSVVSIAVSVAGKNEKGEDSTQSFVFMSGLPLSLCEVIFDMARQGLTEWHKSHSTEPTPMLENATLFPFIMAQQFLLEFAHSEEIPAVLH